MVTSPEQGARPRTETETETETEAETGTEAEAETGTEAGIEDRGPSNAPPWHARYASRACWM
jgi:hypothetical protein